MIKHPEYRAFERSRIAANDAMMALAIGARLAGHLLSQSPDEDADRLLPDVFPTVEGAQKLNRTVEDARLLISSAETHLAYMAIPFALSVHQTYCVQALRLLRRDGIDTATDDPFLIRLEHLHERLMIGGGIALPSDEIVLFDLTRRIRNRLVHYGAGAGAALHSHYANLPPRVRALWRRFTDRDLTVDASTGHLILGLGEFLAVLAVSKHLVREINLGLQSRLSRRTWVQIEWSDAHLVDAARTIHGDDPVLPVRAT